jgi:hypothetical protein
VREKEKIMSDDKRKLSISTTKTLSELVKASKKQNATDQSDDDEGGGGGAGKKMLGSYKKEKAFKLVGQGLLKKVENFLIKEQIDSDTLQKESAVSDDAEERAEAHTEETEKAAEKAHKEHLSGAERTSDTKERRSALSDKASERNFLGNFWDSATNETKNATSLGALTEYTGAIVAGEKMAQGNPQGFSAQSWIGNFANAAERIQALKEGRSPIAGVVGVAATNEIGAVVQQVKSGGVKSALETSTLLAGKKEVAMATAESTERVSNVTRPTKSSGR